MKKLTLNPDALAVESFAPADAPAGARGTVNAHGFGSRNCPPATGMTFCETNCDCTLGCPSIAPCTIQIV
ncbi:MAG TPA: hypothetical protein VFJ16_09600 [Longimicrobium sp.]|nr:hypothetical protein [Longimicrobium sp.]